MNRRRVVALLALTFLACRRPSPSHEMDAGAIDFAAENKPFGAIDASALDTKISPCVDFYSYACGGWEARTRIPDDEGSWLRTFSALRVASDEKAARILDRDRAEPSDVPYSRELGDFFAACMDTTAVDARGDVDLRHELERIDASSPESTTTSIARLHALGIDALFDLEPEPDPENAAVTIALLRQPALAMPESRYADADAVAALRAYAERLFTLAGDDREGARDEAHAAIDLEVELATWFESRASFRNRDHALRFVATHDLPQIQPHLQWPKYFELLHVAPPERIHLATETYLRSMSVAFTDATKLRSLLRWSFLRAMAAQATTPYRDAAFDFARRDTGRTSPPSRERECTRLVENLMGDALASSVVDVDPETAQRALALAGEVRGGLIRAYMADHEDQLAMKITFLRIEIDTPPTFSRAIGFDRQRFIDDVLDAREAARNKRISRIGKPTLDRGVENFFVPNAAFDPRRNRIGISPALLEGASLATNVDAEEVGSLGTIIGHELVHAVDRSGSRYDEYGRFDPTNADNPRDDAEANAIASDLEAAHLRSGPMLDESVADVRGVELARRTLHRLRPDADDRAFFTAYAQTWCGKLRPEATQTLVRSDAHPPPQERVNEVARRSPAFAAAFSCK